MVTAMDETEAESGALQSDASGDAVSVPVQTADSARQLELDFRAPGAADDFARPRDARILARNG